MFREIKAALSSSSLIEFCGAPNGIWTHEYWFCRCAITCIFMYLCELHHPQKPWKVRKGIFSVVLKWCCFRWGCDVCCGCEIRCSLLFSAFAVSPAGYSYPVVNDENGGYRDWQLEVVSRIASVSHLRRSRHRILNPSNVFSLCRPGLHTVQREFLHIANQVHPWGPPLQVQGSYMGAG